MKFNEFMRALDDDVKHVYLLVGTEKFFIDKAREKILSRLNVDKQTELTIIDGGKLQLSEVISTIDSSPFFGTRNVVVIKNTTIFGADGKSERLENVLRDMQPTNYVIFTANAADKRRRLYKLIGKVGAVLEADPLRPWEIDSWLNEKLSSLGKRMSRDARLHFNERIGILQEISLWYLSNELDKVALNVTGNEITAADLRRNMAAPPEVSNFALPEALDERKTPKAVYLLRTQLRDANKAPLVIATLVYHVRQLLRAKFFMAQGVSPQQLGNPLELNPYIARKVGETSRGYSVQILEEAFINLADADFKLKTGRAGVELLEKIIVKLCER